MAMKAQNKEDGLVYSTEFGRMCPQCNKPVKKCNCKKKQTISQSIKSDGIVRLMLEKKGRKGKGVTLITGLPLDHDALKNLAKSLKQKCGCGGSVKNGIIEIQGDQRNVLEKELKSLGYKVKRSGG